MGKHPGQCPVEGCQAWLAGRHVLCARHWYSTPLRLRKRVWREFRRDPSSTVYRAAVRDVVLAAELKVAGL